MSRRILLLGAGFSRNWGGWLASEAFEYLLGCPQVDTYLRNLLWSLKRKGGFEDALAELQLQFLRKPDTQSEQRLTRLQDAIVQMFSDMNKAFAGNIDFELSNGRPILSDFIARFDAIFTLNQDLLMDLHYIRYDKAGSSYGQWNGSEVPGMKPVPGQNQNDPGATKWSPMDQSNFRVSPHKQPYFKLHGSSNWIDNASDRKLLVMGGNKAATIAQHPILKWYHEKFEEYLAKSSTRMMIIGYSFGGDHINKVIEEAIDRETLSIFIVDPLGVDVLDKNRNALIYTPGPLFSRLQPRIMGASRRTVREIFGTDKVEHAKVMRFFA